MKPITILKAIGWIVGGPLLLVGALFILDAGWGLVAGKPTLPDDRIMLDKSRFTAETCAGKFFYGYTGEIEVSNLHHRITGTTLTWKDGKFRPESVDSVVERKVLEAHGVGLWKGYLGEYVGNYIYVGEWEKGYAHGQGKYTEYYDNTAQLFGKVNINLTCDGTFNKGVFVEGTVNGKASTSCTYNDIGEMSSGRITASQHMNDRNIVYQDKYIIACSQE